MLYAMILYIEILNLGEALYTSEQLKIFDDTPFLVFVKSEDLKYLYGNKCFLGLVVTAPSTIR